MHAHTKFTLTPTSTHLCIWTLQQRSIHYASMVSRMLCFEGVSLPIIIDEGGVIWLKCNNTEQIWYNPAHPSNWQRRDNLDSTFLVSVSDLSSIKILWSQCGRERYAEQTPQHRPSLMEICLYLLDTKSTMH